MCKYYFACCTIFLVAQFVKFCSYVEEGKWVYIELVTEFAISFFFPVGNVVFVFSCVK